MKHIELHFEKRLLKIRGKFSILMIILFFCACTNSQQIKRAGMHNFEYKGEKYRIRTIISSLEKESRNELIGKSFLAVDMNQDRLIDQIQLGKIGLAEAQEIYDYCLESLAAENKLKLIERQVDFFRQSSVSFDYEIATFKPENGTPFNEFRIVDKRNVAKHIMNVYLDQNADGILEDRLKGTLSVKNAQLRYTRIIKKGLKRARLIRTGQQILVQPK